MQALSHHTVKSSHGLQPPRTRRRVLGCKAVPPGEDGPSTSAPSQPSGAPQPSISDPVQTIAWGGTLPPTRRLVLSGLTASAVALGGNLGGVTSRLLGLDGGGLAKSLKLDTIIPVQASPAPYKRCLNGSYGFEFTYPSRWLADQTVAQRAAERAEAARSLDLPPLARGPARPKRSVYEPVAAYGPPGSSGEQNMSVIVAPVLEGFSLQSMGSPDKVALQFLQSLAPEGSGKQAELLSASSRQDPRTGQLYYTFEYIFRGPNFVRHNASVITAKYNQLYTFNAQAPQSAWERDAELLRASAASFALTSSPLDTTGFPQRL